MSFSETKSFRERAEVVMSRGIIPGAEAVRGDQKTGAVDVSTILENVVLLDEMLDEGSRKELDEMPYLELSKHMRIRK